MCGSPSGSSHAIGFQTPSCLRKHKCRLFVLIFSHKAWHLKVTLKANFFTTGGWELIESCDKCNAAICGLMSEAISMFSYSKQKCCKHHSFVSDFSDRECGAVINDIAWRTLSDPHKINIFESWRFLSVAALTLKTPLSIMSRMCLCWCASRQRWDEKKEKSLHRLLSGMLVFCRARLWAKT